MGETLNLSSLERSKSTQNTPTFLPRDFSLWSVVRAQGTTSHCAVESAVWLLAFWGDVLEAGYHRENHHKNGYTLW
jgi:hypothetical protein